MSSSFCPSNNLFWIRILWRILENNFRIFSNAHPVWMDLHYFWMLERSTDSFLHTNQKLIFSKLIGYTTSCNSLYLWAFSEHKRCARKFWKSHCFLRLKVSLRYSFWNLFSRQQLFKNRFTQNGAPCNVCRTTLYLLKKKILYWFMRCQEA